MYISERGLNRLLVTLLWQPDLVSVVQIIRSLNFLDFQNQCSHLTKKWNWHSHKSRPDWDVDIYTQLKVTFDAEYFYLNSR